MTIPKNQRTPCRLRLEARYAYLDNRMAQARKYEREALQMEQRNVGR